MTSSGEGHGTSGDDPPQQPDSSRPLASNLLSLACCVAALLCSFLGLFEWDVPVTRLVRSLNDVQIDHLSNPWLARLSDGGDRIGRGESLVAISLIIVAVGYALREATWKVAGWQTLLAHGMAAVVSNGLKHLVGRPRPKFMHAGNLELSPAGGAGWDSFPSGHASASFAIAAVLAARFPKLRWLTFSVAAAVAVSRILRGSHYVTDAIGGAAVGVLVGTVASRPWREWKQSVESALFVLVMPVTTLLLLFAILGAPPIMEGWSRLAVPIGMGLVLTGTAGLLVAAVKPHTGPGPWDGLLGRILSLVGFGFMTGSALAIAAVSCAGAAAWLRQSPREDASVRSTSWNVVVAVSLLMALVLAVELRGAWLIR